MAAVGLAAVAAAAAATAAAPAPSFLFVVVDDLGWNDVGFQNSAMPGQRNVMQTPVIDGLARDGIVLDDYTVFRYCSPSRSQMLVGRYAYHVGQQSANLGPTNGGCALPAAYDMLPAALKKSSPHSYKTHAFGKYHQGFYARRFTPTARGFDTFCGFYDGGESHFTHITPFKVWNDPGIPYSWTPADRKAYPPRGCGALVDLSNNTVDRMTAAPASLNGTFSSDITTSEVLRIVSAHPSPDVPIFLYVAYHAVHTPLEVDEGYRKRYEPLVADRDRQVLGGMISVVDDGVGAIVQRLKDKALWDSTLVVFVTDNGGPVCLNPTPETQHGEKLVKSCGTNNFPLRGSKMTYWQGGTRGVGLVSGPLVPAPARGTRHTGMVHQVDWYVTLLLLAGLTPAQINATGPVAVDGVDQWASLTRGLPSPRTEVVHNINTLGSEGAIRVGRWKLITGHNWTGQYNADDGWWEPPEMGGAYTPSPEKLPCLEHPCLFDLEADKAERVDLGRNATHAGVLAQLLARYEELRKTEVSREAAGLCVSVPDGCVANEKGGVWEPWVDDV